MTPDELVKKIFEIITLLNEQKTSELSGDTLSRLALRLASYKASLGEHVAEARKLALDAEATYKAERVAAYRRLRDDGKGATDADELKNVETHDFFVKANQAKYNFERISILHKDCHDLIDGIRSRLIHLQSERSESGGF